MTGDDPLLEMTVNPLRVKQWYANYNTNPQGRLTKCLWHRFEKSIVRSSTIALNIGIVSAELEEIICEIFVSHIDKILGI